MGTWDVLNRVNQATCRAGLGFLVQVVHLVFVWNPNGLQCTRWDLRLVQLVQGLGLKG